MAENWGQHRPPVNHDRAGPSKLRNSDFFEMSSDNVPVRLLVLIYADNLVNLHNYKNYLEMNDYRVFTTFSKERAMNLLCNHRNIFDIALIEVHKPEGHIFQSISQIGNQLDCPIIVISKDASKESVMKWMSNGAWDCLIEPIKIENDLKFIFKHVVRMRAQRSIMVAGEKAAGEKSSSVGPNYNGDHSSEASTSKKKRCVWYSTLNEKFMNAVNHFGIENANPKKILAYMDDPNLTRDNVASHLQKYRQKEKEKEKKKSLNISEDKRNGVGEEATELKRKTEVKPQTSHINNIPRPFSEQQNIINPNDVMPYPIPSSFRHHHGEVCVACMMTHQQISEQQNIINPNDVMSHQIPFRLRHGEVSVASLMTHQQYQTTNFSTQPNSNNNSGGTNILFTNMDDETDFANCGFLNGYETDPKPYNCNVKDTETDSEFTDDSSYPDQNTNTNVDGFNLMDSETNPKFNNNSGQPK